MTKRRTQPATTSPTPAQPTLPKGIVARDLTRPSYSDADGYPPSEYDNAPSDKALPFEDRMFELWLVSAFGWVIPTLSISHGGQRTYAVAIGEGGARDIRRGAQVRVGRGPHVLAQHTVHIRASRLAALRPFIDLRRDGAVGANVTRDRISSRRAQGSRMRSEGRHSWRWDV